MRETAAPARSEPLPASARPMALWWAALLAFTASAGTLVVELVAARMLAPYIGSSLYTWTSILGVVLGGISLGNWLGGRIADQRASARLVGTLFLVGALATAGSLLLVAGLGPLSRVLPLLPRTFILSAIAFMPMSLVLAMVTPAVIRLALPDLRRTGRVVGLVYAVGTAGSLVGNFATGLVLTAYFNVSTIVLAVAAILAVLGLIAGQWWRPAAMMSKTPPVPRATSLNGASQNELPRGPFDLGGNAGLACAVVAVSSFATMGIELAASRILAPYLGLSLYSWTGIIGVVLLAITVGNYLGGWIADRWPSQRTLGLSLFVGGTGALAILLLVELLDARGLWAGYGLVARIVLETAAVFFLPILLLSTISPQVTRLAVTDVRRSGRIAGEIYAWSTAGAIMGTFATGWALISAFGVHLVVFVLAVTLVALSFLVGRFWESPWLLRGLAAVALVSMAGLHYRDAIRSRCTVETHYFCIKVGDEVKSVGPVKTLVLDHLVHSYVKLDDPTYLGYVHEQVQAEITDYLTEGRPDPKVLVIGGGGYTYPRWVEARLPRVGVEVVEIDPGVTEISHTHLGLPRATRIASWNLDGRQFVQELAPRAGYTLVIQDAVNDLSVPYHIMTREYNDRVRDLLQPGGAYLLTVIDLFRDGQLLRAALRTMQQSFPNVQLLASGPSWQGGGANVWIIAGSQRGIEVPRLHTELARRSWPNVLTTEMPPTELAAYVAAEPRIVLTDEYAPVDNLIAILFASRG